MERQTTGISVASRKNGRTADEDLPADKESRVARALAKGRPADGSGFAALMSDLMLDVLEGSIPVKQANAACNVAQTMLKGIELEMKKKLIGGPKDASSLGDETLICDFLESQGGKAVKPAIIAKETGLSRARVNAAVDHEWFSRTPGGIVIVE